ncbi:MAG: UDP-Glc:alpha-D-GlcNAc-diphosphoundecaprenol beta-1,3-glucosyltransferase WfgD [Gammaproteobacteria bacterium]|nr:UDP-Glc:alpha-D-GlcNAc-diphosphoundecaprenol beta-1,3-glucosyltransferase WfgD [Gammaproteobacteria bacterium]
MLIEKNEFELQGYVYMHHGSSGLDRGDSQGVEAYLKTVLENASDLSSYSLELGSHIQDSATEVHLSAKRANLLRGFDLSGFDRVLEVGCGGGAVTRYLGEQGLSVDAVERNPRHSELAALRCRDLDSVTVYSGDIGSMELPEDHYDLICLIGAAEYAPRFLKSESAASEPVVELLARLKSALKPTGLMMIGTENRAGMKYVLGAHEDHYAKRFMGINNYFGEKDINTYTLPEWNGTLSASGITDKMVYLPFPDYKLPTVLISQHFARNNPHAFCNLEGVNSRDYIQVFRPGISESMFWQSAAAADTMDAYANSFLFLLTFGEERVDRKHRIDFVHLPNFSRRPEYCVIAAKQEGKEIVERRRVVEGRPDDQAISQRLVDEPYYRGTLLSVSWARALEIEPESRRFLALVEGYLEFLRDREGLSIDLIPSNIVVDEAGEFHAFDEEWELKEGISIGFLLFRALLILVVKSEGAVRRYARTHNLDTVREFISHVADCVGMDLPNRIDEYINLEEKFQTHTAVGERENLTQKALHKPLCEEEKLVEPVKGRLYWRQSGEAYTETRFRAVYMDVVDEMQTINVKLPPAAGGADQLRFNPCEEIRPDGVGFMRFYRMEVRSIDPSTQAKTTLWRLEGEEEIVRYTRMYGIQYGQSGLGSIFMITKDDPWFEFDFIPGAKLSGWEYLEFVCDLRIPHSREYLLAKDRYLQAQERFEDSLRDREDLHDSHERIKEELATIKASRFWDAITRYRTTRHTIDEAWGRVAYWRSSIRTLGFRRTFIRLYDKVETRVLIALGKRTETTGPPTHYEIWRSKYLEQVLPVVTKGPLISVIMPVYNVSSDALRKAVESLKKQTYKNWELCITDDASSNRDTLGALAKMKDKRIKIKYSKVNRNISGATNSAVELSKGGYLAFMDNDDELAENALSEIASAIINKQADCIYTDEDFIKTDGHLDHPHFKPDYNPDLLLSHNYITHLLVMKRELFDKVGGPRSEYDGAQDYDLVLRAVEQASNIVHVAKPLYHWRMTESSTSLNPVIKTGSHESARKALRAATERRGINATVEDAGMPHFFRVKRDVGNKPLVSIVVPFRDKSGLLKNCMHSVLEKTTYESFEIIGISNDSYSSYTNKEMNRLERMDNRIRFREMNGGFNFSKLINYGVAECNGEHIVLLNNDIEIVTPDWIEAFLEHSQREEVAAVGGKLYFPNNTVQHAGIAIGLGGYAGHLHKNFRADAPGYFNRLGIVQNVSAVTGALMMVERSKYRDLGGFDEEEFSIAYNDVDFCLRGREAGYLNVFTPYVEAYHRESASRGYEETPEKKKRFSREQDNLLARHGEAIRRGDPYYNPNFDQGRDDFRLAT